MQLVQIGWMRLTYEVRVRDAEGREECAVVGADSRLVVPPSGQGYIVDATPAAERLVERMFETVDRVCLGSDTDRDGLR